MADGRDRPEPPPERARPAETRQERLAQAMRANLRRRKAQQRAREQAAVPPEPVEEG